MNKYWASLIALSVVTLGVLSAKDISEVQSVDGGQRNQITVTGGGGGAGDVTASGNNAFTGNNTHAGTETFNGSTSASNLIIQTRAVIGTNSLQSGYTLWMQGTTAGDYLAFVGAAGGGNGLYIANNDFSKFVTLDYDGANSGRQRLTGLSDMVYSFATAGTFKFQPAVGASELIIANGALTLGQNSSSVLTIPSATATAANGLNFNSGTVIIPAAGGTVTNSTLTALNTVYSTTTLTPATSVNIDFNSADIQVLNNATNVTFTESNAGAGKSKTLVIVNDSVARTVTWPAWTAIGSPLPTGLTASKTLVVNILHTGSTEASGLVTTAAQP